MAVKPAVSYTFATDATYGSGPAVGLSNKIAPASLPQGFIPGVGINAEGVNYLENINGLWSVWLLAGSTAPGLDAHLVETNGTGAISVALGIFGGTASTFTALYASENSGATAVSAHFQNTVAGEAVRAQASTGYALRLVQDTDAVGTPGAVRQTVRTTEPTSVNEGDLYYRGGDYHRPGFRDNNAWKYAHGSAGGLVRKYGEDATESSTTSGGSLSNKVSATLVSADNAVAGTTVHLRAVCEVGTDVAGSIIKLGIVDGTAGGTPIVTQGDGGAGTQRTIQTYQASTGADERYVVLEADYVLPASGARVFFLGYISNGSDTAYIRFASLEITGAF